MKADTPLTRWELRTLRAAYRKLGTRRLAGRQFTDADEAVCLSLVIAAARRGDTEAAEWLDAEGISWR